MLNCIVHFNKGCDFLKKLENEENKNVANENTKKSKKILKVILKIFLIIFVSIVIFVLTTFLTALIYLNSKFGKIEFDNLTKSDVYIDNNIDKELSDYRNIAILGIDARSDTFSRGNRSDCIMIVSINKKNKDVKIASVYRDTYLDIENRGLDKVTHAYSFGEARLAINTLNRNLDLNISEYVAINFDTVRTAVDEVGGVTITLDADEVKYINGYINALNKQFGTSSKNITKPGTYNLDGVQALAYGRIRYTNGGDYKRTERMRDVLLAVFDKAKKSDIATLNNLLDTMLPHVRTNISKNNILALIPSIASYNVTDNFGWPYEVDGKIINKVWYGVPVNLEANVSKLHKQLFNQDNYTPSATVQTISNDIKEKTK